MSYIEYRAKKFTAAHQELIAHCNEVVDDFGRQGYALTIRQLYYQLVTKNLIPNNIPSYKRLVDLCGEARLAGEMDWAAFEDRTRSFKGGGGFESPEATIDALARIYHVDRWEDQPCCVQVWVEKEAAESVIERVANRNNVRYICCKGYLSLTTIESGANDLVTEMERGKEVVVIYIGDHDPSGIQMTEDVESRLRMFIEYHLGANYMLNVVRVALNRDQVDHYDIPPNPCKTTDSRSAPYIARFGNESWELDAIRPQELDRLIEQEIQVWRDDDLYEAQVERETVERTALAKIARNWPAISQAVARGDFDGVR